MDIRKLISLILIQPRKNRNIISLLNKYNNSTMCWWRMKWYTEVSPPLRESLFFCYHPFCLCFVPGEDPLFVRSKASFIWEQGCCKKLVIWLIICCTGSTFLATTYSLFIAHQDMRRIILLFFDSFILKEPRALWADFGLRVLMDLSKLISKSSLTGFLSFWREGFSAKFWSNNTFFRVSKIICIKRYFNWTT